jgi:hypothetical protein
LLKLLPAHHRRPAFSFISFGGGKWKALEKQEKLLT